MQLLECTSRLTSCCLCLTARNVCCLLQQAQNAACCSWLAISNGQVAHPRAPERLQRAQKHQQLHQHSSLNKEATLDRWCHCCAPALQPAQVAGERRSSLTLGRCLKARGVASCGRATSSWSDVSSTLRRHATSCTHFTLDLFGGAHPIGSSALHLLARAPLRRNAGQQQPWQRH